MAHALCTWLSLVATVVLLLLSYHSSNKIYSSTSLVEIEEQKNFIMTERTRSLSRRRRYLIFPDGSSLQMVFCLTYPMNITIGDIFLMGITAAMAWELPKEPYGPFGHKSASSVRSDRNRDLYYDNKKRSLSEHIHERNIISNSKLSKRSTPSVPIHSGRNYLPDFDRVKMHEKQKNREFMYQGHMPPSSVEFHRNSRKGLYNKVESLLSGVGHDGRQCVLKTLCEIGRNRDEDQGTFLDEIVRAIFTLPRGTDFDEEHHREYDKAHAAQDNCEMLYPNCKYSVKDIPFR